MNNTKPLWLILITLTSLVLSSCNDTSAPMKSDVAHAFYQSGVVTELHHRPIHASRVHKTVANHPPGSYWNSCKDCSMAVYRLNCFCQQDNGDHQASSVYVNRSCHWIDNINGNLKCFRRYPQRRYKTK